MNYFCRKCKQDSDSEQSTEIYTRKELGMMEKTISNFYTSFYFPEIQKLAFHIPHVQIMGTSHCGDSHKKPFKLSESFQDVLCRHEYDDNLVSSISNQILSEYYSGNISLSIEVIALENFSALPRSGIKSSTKPCQRHAVFKSFFRMMANNMLPLILYTANIWLNC